MKWDYNKALYSLVLPEVVAIKLETGKHEREIPIYMSTDLYESIGGLPRISKNLTWFGHPVIEMNRTKPIVGGAWDGWPPGHIGLTTKWREWE